MAEGRVRVPAFVRVAQVAGMVVWAGTAEFARDEGVVAVRQGQRRVGVAVVEELHVEDEAIVEWGGEGGVVEAGCQIPDRGGFWFRGLQDHEERGQLAAAALVDGFVELPVRSRHCDGGAGQEEEVVEVLEE